MKKPHVSRLAVIETALTAARARMTACGLTKDGDLAVCLSVELAALGFKLVRIPATKH